MNAFMKRAERVEAALEALKQRKGTQPVLIYADGSRCSMGVLEAGYYSPASFSISPFFDSKTLIYCLQAQRISLILDRPEYSAI